MKIAPICLLLAFAPLAFGVSSQVSVVTPEPATVILLGTGLAGIVYAGWRRNHKK